MMFTVWFIALFSCFLLARWTYLITFRPSDWGGWVVEAVLLFTAATSTGIIFAGGWPQFAAQFAGA